MSGSTEKKAGSEGKKKNGVIVAVTLLAILVVTLITVVVILLAKNKDKDADAEAPPVTEERREVADSVRTILDEDSANDIMEQMREEVAEGMFECEMSMTWNFDNGQAESKDAYVANSTSNTHPIIFDVYLQDTEELLYSSPVLPVGTSIANFKLDKELPAGSYKATVMYSLLADAESQDVISSAGFVVTINVLN
jgi:hypothetical protein